MVSVLVIERPKIWSAEDRKEIERGKVGGRAGRSCTRDTDQSGCYKNARLTIESLRPSHYCLE